MASTFLFFSSVILSCFRIGTVEESSWAQLNTKCCAQVLCRYVAEDPRFRSGYSKHNPRKMVKVWAEKERRNLMRLNAAAIRSPRALQLRSHVLVMEFIGADGVAAPRLKVQPPSKLHLSVSHLFAN